MLKYKALIISIALSCIIHASGCLGQEHRIKPGDVVDILVYGHPEISRAIAVNPNGTVNYPLLQNIPVDGLTLNELREIIVVQLSKIIVQTPFVTLTLVETYTINVVVLGHVLRPGSYQIPVNATVQGAIGQAGGFLAGANLSGIKIIQKKQDSAARHEEARIVDLREFLINGDPDLLPALGNGDIVVVPGFSGSIAVKVLGEVNRPGSFDIVFGNNNLLDVLFLAGGPTKEADLTRVVISSPRAGQNQELHVDLKERMIATIYEQVPDVQPGDVIFIPKKRTSAWRVMLGLVRDVTPFISLYYMIRLANRH